jgi:hypothetical protein
LFKYHKNVEAGGSSVFSASWDTGDCNSIFSFYYEALPFLQIQEQLWHQQGLLYTVQV